ncbi:MAG TPA: DUF3455 domain-containing protein [Casimicrobiaceae bacterium]|nr:DUF3455 domain-containing protein [Casimicrobiaceae bacterium]
MNARHMRGAQILGVAILLAGCSASPPAGPSASAPDSLRPPAAPEALRPPASQTLVLAARATGVQIYECAVNPAGRYEWTLKAPEAELFDETGRKVGKHYAGPTWEALDGSKVVGEVRARDDGPDPNAIPWLLLAAKSNSPTGALSTIRSIQRLQTVEGKAPSTPCDRASAQQVARVPYKANYYFYAAKS